MVSGLMKLGDLWYHQNTFLETCVVDWSADTEEVGAFVCIGREWKGGMLERETFF